MRLFEFPPNRHSIPSFFVMAMTETEALMKVSEYIERHPENHDLSDWPNSYDPCQEWKGGVGVSENG